MEYKLLQGIETPKMGIKVMVAGIERDLEKSEKNLVYDFTENFLNLIRHNNNLLNPEEMQGAECQRLHLMSLFTCPIYVKEIPNEYYRQPYHVPWYMVTTLKGNIKIGWRKRVISIDWKASEVLATAQDLFPGEDVTKYDKLIHAHGYEKAREYIKKILAL